MSIVANPSFVVNENLVPPGLHPELYQPGFTRWLHVMGNSLQVINGCAELGYLEQCPNAQVMMLNHLTRLKQLCAEMRRCATAVADGGE